MCVPILRQEVLEHRASRSRRTPSTHGAAHLRGTSGFHSLDMPGPWPSPSLPASVALDGPKLDGHAQTPSETPSLIGVRAPSSPRGASAERPVMVNLARRWVPRSTSGRAVGITGGGDTACLPISATPAAGESSCTASYLAVGCGASTSGVVVSEPLQELAPKTRSRRQALATTSRTSTSSNVTPSGTVPGIRSLAARAASSDSKTIMESPALPLRVQYPATKPGACET
jgi:hypothetical protein